MIVGFTNGCFDVFHQGHDHYLRQCKAACNYLIVAVNSDAYCREVKGADRPVWNWRRRMQYVRTLCNAVIPFEGRWEKLVLEIRPDVIFQGEEYRPAEAKDCVLAARRKGWKELGHGFDVMPIIYIPRFGNWSTTSEIERLGVAKA